MAEKSEKGGGSAGKKPRYKRSWKNYLIDKDYQLRYTLISVLICAILCGALGAVVVWQMREATSMFTAQRNKATKLFEKQRAKSTKLVTKVRANATTDVKKLLKTATDMLDVQLQDKDPANRALAREVKKNLEEDDKKRVGRRNAEDKKFSELRQKADREMVAQRRRHDQQALKERETKELILIGVIIGVGLMFLVVIFLFNIVITHKVAGPMFKMGRYMDEVRDGKYTEVWNLRKGDRLVDFYKRFQSMHNAVKDREAKDVEVLEAALAACEKEGLGGEAIEAMQARLQDKKKSLGLTEEAKS